MSHPEAEKKLLELGDVFAKCWNEVNHLRRQRFFNEVGVDFATTEKMIYEKYKQYKKVKFRSHRSQRQQAYLQAPL